jgi:hypothetical protein
MLRKEAGLFIAKFVGRNWFIHDNSVICPRAKEVGV